jgi:hypothetical protein
MPAAVSGVAGGSAAAGWLLGADGRESAVAVPPVWGGGAEPPHAMRPPRPTPSRTLEIFMRRHPPTAKERG